MSAPLVEQACAKINLTLRVLGRRADGYHRLESLVAFADLADTLSLQPAASDSLDISGPFAAACGTLADNSVLKAAAALRRRAGALSGGKFVLEKTLPVAAGIGGGSADAGAALRLLARTNRLASEDARLTAAALDVGADVPVCLDPRARVMRGIGEELSAPVALPPLPALLVNPGVPLATRDVFAALTLKGDAEKAMGTVPAAAEALLDFLAAHGNDLTEAAISRAPPVAAVLAALKALPGARLARMSGSGPTCFALFGDPSAAAAAARDLARERQNWWVRAATLR